MLKDYIVIQDEAMWNAYNYKIFTIKAESVEQAIENVKICEENDPKVDYSQVSYEAKELGTIIQKPRFVLEQSGG